MSYIPEVGDIIWLEFDPQAGHEQAGHRPAVVLTPKAYNQATGLLICCPLTTKIKGYPFEVTIEGTPQMLPYRTKSKAWIGKHVMQSIKAMSVKLSLRQLNKKLGCC